MPQHAVRRRDGVSDRRAVLIVGDHDASARGVYVFGRASKPVDGRQGETPGTSPCHAGLGTDSWQSSPVPPLPPRGSSSQTLKPCGCPPSVRHGRGEILSVGNWEVWRDPSSPNPPETFRALD